MNTSPTGSKALRDERGFTLIELLVAVVIFSVILTAAVTLYSTVLKTYLQDKVTQELQREGDSVVAHMSRNLKSAVTLDAQNSNFATNPNTLQVKLVTSSQTRKYYVTSSQIHYVDETGADTNLLSPGTTVTSLTFTPTSNSEGNLVSILIRATLQRGRYGQTKTLDIGTSVAMRPQ